MRFAGTRMEGFMVMIIAQISETWESGLAIQK